jgi:hypothetical protein
MNMELNHCKIESVERGCNNTGEARNEHNKQQDIVDGHESGSWIVSHYGDNNLQEGCSATSWGFSVQLSGINVIQTRVL